LVYFNDKQEDDINEQLRKHNTKDIQIKCYIMIKVLYLTWSKNVLFCDFKIDFANRFFVIATWRASFCDYYTLETGHPRGATIPMVAGVC
jgi:hypothetical protein